MKHEPRHNITRFAVRGSDFQYWRCACGINPLPTLIEAEKHIVLSAKMEEE